MRGRVKYTLGTKLVNELVEASDKHLSKTTSRYGRVDLLFIDGLHGTGPPRSRAAAPGAHRTRRKGFGGHRVQRKLHMDGTKTFTDPRLCAAIVHRFTFGGNIIETGTESFRLAQTRANHLPTTTAEDDEWGPGAISGRTCQLRCPRSSSGGHWSL